MDSKMKHRILAIVVIAGVAILAYPFLIGGNSNTTEIAAINPPSFPDQAIQVSANDETVTPNAAATPVAPNAEENAQIPVADNTIADQAIDDPSLTGSGDDLTIANSDTNTTTATVVPNNETTDTTASAPTAESNNANTVIIPATPNSEPKATEQPTATQQPTATRVQHVNNEPVTAPKQTTKAAKKVAEKSHPTHKQATAKAMQSKLSKSAIAAYKRTPIDNNGLLKLKKAAWVIQLGSFKNKAHALRLVNQLRAEGYRAFIQHVNVASGENTRVFVGPEHQEKAARQLASEINTSMKLRGIVISYKPFTL